jgi:hypothetical protein
MSGYQIMRDLSADEYAELKNDIAERGVLVLVEYDEDDNILDGHHWVKACQALGIMTWLKITRSRFTAEEKHRYARTLTLAPECPIMGALLKGRYAGGRDCT